MKKLLSMLILLVFCHTAYSQWHPVSGYIQLGPDYYYDGALDFELSPDNSIYVFYSYSGYSIHETFFKMVKSIDGGVNWSGMSGFYSNGTIKQIQCVAPEQIIELNYYQGNSFINTTSDDFASWTQIPGSYGNDNYTAYDFLNLSSGFVLKDYPDRDLGKVENGQYTSTTGDTVNFKFGSVKMLNDTTAFLLCRDNNVPNSNLSGNNMILKTTDFGITWTTIFKNSLYNINHFTFTSEDNGILVGKQGTVIQTTDGGISWTPMESGTNKQINYINERNGIYFCVGDSGLILKKEANSDLWNDISFGTSEYLKIKLDANMVGYILTPTSIIRSDEVLEFKNIQVTEPIVTYPNPCSDQLYYNCSNLNRLKGIRLQNSVGQEVYSASNGLNGHLDVSYLDAGIYFLSFDIGNQTIVKKMVIMSR